MLVDLIDGVRGVTALKENWEEVYALDKEAQIFLSFDWMSRWLAQLTIAWTVMAVKPAEGARYVAFLPVQLRVGENKDGTFFNTIRMGGMDYATYTGILCDPRHEEEAISAIAGKLKSMNWTYLHLDDFCASPERLKRFLGHFENKDFARIVKKRPVHVTDEGQDIDHNIYVRVPLPGDWETYLQNQLKTNTRRDVRAFLRKVEGGEDYRVTVADEETYERDFNALMGLWRAQWEKKDKTYAGFIDHNTRKMLAPMAKPGQVFLPVLWQGDRPIGAHVALVDRVQKTLMCLLVSRDLTVKKPPPGLVLHAYSIRWAIEQGFTYYDLLRGNFTYKYSFGPEERRFECLRINTANAKNIGNRLEPRAIHICVGLAQKYLRAGKRGEAERAFRQILEADPNNAEAKLSFSAAGNGQMINLAAKFRRRWRCTIGATAIRPRSSTAPF
ncbi:MAG: GNAT family N-acetyltransferase [Alphaproteobacteria bacterium]